MGLTERKLEGLWADQRQAKATRAASLIEQPTMVSTMGLFHVLLKRIALDAGATRRLCKRGGEMVEEGGQIERFRCCPRSCSIVQQTVFIRSQPNHTLI